MTTGIVQLNGGRRERTKNGFTWQLLNLLADGEFHSGEVLANRLGVSRASVFNALAGVADYGVLLQRIRGRGYRLARPWQRLERDEIWRWLGYENLLMEPLAIRLGEQTTPQVFSPDPGLVRYRDIAASRFQQYLAVAACRASCKRCRKRGRARWQRAGGGVADCRTRADGADLAFRPGHGADVFAVVAF